MSFEDKMSQIHTNDLEAKGELTALLQYANGVTGEQDTRIGDAVYRLAQGYGQGGGSAWELITTITVSDDSTPSVKAEFDPMEEIMVIAICPMVNSAQAHYYTVNKGKTNNRPSVSFSQNVANQSSVFYTNRFGGYIGKAAAAATAHTRGVAANTMSFFGAKISFVGIEAQTWSNSQKLWNGTTFYVYGKR